MTPATTIADPILEIRMQSNYVDCRVCGKPTEHQWGVPVYNGDIVSNDFPDDLWSGGISVCRDCFDEHAAGRMPTFDRYYVRPGFIGGDGI